jgi:hypothetical protein
MIFAIHDVNDRGPIDVADHRESRSNRCHANSESRLLAMKKFSRLPPSRLNTARQGRLFARIDCG